MNEQIVAILEEIAQETTRFDSLYDRHLHALAIKALTIIAAQQPAAAEDDR